MKEYILGFKVEPYYHRLRSNVKNKRLRVPGNIVQYDNIQNATSGSENPVGVFADNIDKAKEKYIEISKRWFMPIDWESVPLKAILLTTSIANSFLKRNA